MKFVGGRKIGPGSDGQGLCVHALAITQKLGNRNLLFVHLSVYNYGLAIAYSAEFREAVANIL